jgi:hypothetical protein
MRSFHNDKDPDGPYFLRTLPARFALILHLICECEERGPPPSQLVYH